MALTLRPLPRRNLLRLLPSLSPLSTSAPSPDPRELLRIQRILHSHASGAAQPREEHSRSATTATVSIGLQTILERGVGLTTSESTSLIRRLPATLAPHRLGRLLQELAGLRIPADEIKAVLASDPDGLLSMDPGEPSRLLELLSQLWCRKAVKDQVLARGVLRAAVAARRRVELLHTRGLTRQEALRVIAGEPRALLYPLEDVERKVEYLVDAMGFEVAWLVQYPEFLGVNLDSWIIPRHKVLEYLRSVDGLGDPAEMKHYVRFSRHRFYNMFVKPYPECESIFGGLVRPRRDETVRRRHPSGLWKLFTPVKHERTKEDVENMKALIQSLR